MSSDPSQLRALVASALARVRADAADGALGSDGHPWQERANYPLQHLRIYSCDAAPDQPKRFKGVGVVLFPAEAILQSIRDYGARVLPWATNLEVSKLTPIDDPSGAAQLYLQYTVTRSKFGVSRRDFITVISEEPLPGGGWVRGGTGLLEHEMYPPLDGAVRALNHPCGWHITPLDASSCRVVFVAHTDVRGWLPHWLVAQATVGSLKEFFDGLCSTLASASAAA